MRSVKVQLSLGAENRSGPDGWSNPIVPGDHPDPTVIRVGRTFWASCTSGEWSPQFPLFRSTDLVGWKLAGSIFPTQPAWAEGSFWAPELVHDELSGRFFVWYVGRKRGGPLCIALATASSPGGPYTDHGPVLCQEDGAIDPCFARDEHGEPFLIWKEDGNSQGRPTPIWAQALSDDFLHLVGERTQLITNDAPWEEGIVEGPYILRHERRFYLFYAGNSCCGKECKYAEGVARADRLLGPWEKFPGNPLIGANDRWRCPGHGTAVRVAARDGQPAQEYLLYHAYPAEGGIYVGREAVLDRITWSAPEADGRPGWPMVNAGGGPGEPAPTQPVDFVDLFTATVLGPSWQWPVNTAPGVLVGHGSLELTIPLISPLTPSPVESALIAVPSPAGAGYRAAVTLVASGSPDPALWYGLAVVGDPFNTIGLGLRGKPNRDGLLLVLWERRGATQRVIWQVDAPEAPLLSLRAEEFGPENHIQFSYSSGGKAWQAAGSPYDASDLPAWDRSLRIGLLLEGRRGATAAFQHFALQSGN